MATAKKKPAAKRTKRATPVQRSFVRSKETQPFMSFRLTHQTVYWLIIGMLVLALGAWIVSLNVRLQGLYDQVQVLQSENASHIIKQK